VTGAGPPAPLPVAVAAATVAGLRALRTQIARAQRLIEHLLQDAARAATADELRLGGEVLKTQLSAVPKGAKVIELTVPWQPDRVVVVRLRPELTIHDNVRHLFDRAKALARSGPIVQTRRAAALDRLQALQAHQAGHAALMERAAAWQHARDRGQVTPDRPRDILRAAHAWLAALGPLGVVVQALPRPRAAARDRAQTGLPAGVESFTSPAGARVLVGRSAAGNDAVVTRVLRGRDLWFHLRDAPGAHVVLRVGAAAPADAELQACAQLCAHLSGVQKGDRAEVRVCPGTEVRKVKGAPAGSVYAPTGRSLLVVVHPEVVDGFYARRHGARVDRPS